MAIICRASHVLDTNALYCHHDAIFQPHLNYCIEVWENTCMNNINAVFIQQQKVIQIVRHSTSLDHTYKMFCPLDILKTYDLHTCIYMHKVFHKLVLFALLGLFSI